MHICGITFVSLLRKNENVKSPFNFELGGRPCTGYMYEYFMEHQARMEHLLKILRTDKIMNNLEIWTINLDRISKSGQLRSKSGHSN